MVTGIERWKEYFNDYKDKYVLIGGVYQIESRDHNTYTLVLRSLSPKLAFIY